MPDSQPTGIRKFLGWFVTFVTLSFFVVILQAYLQDDPRDRPDTLCYPAYRLQVLVTVRTLNNPIIRQPINAARAAARAERWNRRCIGLASNLPGFAPPRYLERDRSPEERRKRRKQ